MSFIGKRIRPVDWREKTSGQSRFVLDDIPAGALWTGIVRSPHPHARIKSVDIAKARALPGVCDVITGADFSGARYDEGTELADRHPLARDKVRFIGDEVAVVAAETAEIAREAAALVRVRYRRLEAPTTVADALRPGQVRLHDRVSGTNRSTHMSGTHGEFDAAVQSAAYSVHGVFQYPRVAQAPMEPSACVAIWDPDRRVMDLRSTTQSPRIVTEVVADMLGLKRGQVIFRETAVGGGFGARSRTCEYEVLTAMLSLRTGRPVVTSLTREEEFTATRSRHAFTTELTGYASADGLLSAFDAQITMNNGAYNLSGPFVMAVALHGLGGMYRPSGVRWDAKLIDTALVPGGQMRGLGYPQVALASESLIDQLAEKVGEDPLDYRTRNANYAGQKTLGGGEIGSSGLVACLEAVGDAIEWRRKKRERRPFRGVGVAAGMHGAGDNGGRADANRSDVTIDIDESGKVRVRYGTIDFGTHQRTVLVQIAAELLGVPLHDVEIIQADTELTPHELGQWGSRGTYFGGHAVKLCAEQLVQRLCDLAEPMLGEGVEIVEGCVIGRHGRMPLGDLIRHDPGFSDGVLSMHSSFVEPILKFDPENPVIDEVSGTYSFAAHAAEVEVDPATGKISVTDYVAAHDIGRAMNPSACDGQIIGAVVMGLGAVLGEELIHKEGRPVNPAYLHYALPRAADVPEVRPILIEGATDNGPFGAKSVGELPLVLAAPAVLNAVYDATEIRFDSLPLTPDKVLKALRDKEGRAPRRYRLWRRPERWQIDLMRRAYPFGVHAIMHRLGRKVAHRYHPPVAAPVSHPVTAADLAAEAVSGHTVMGGGTDLRLQIRQGIQTPKAFASVRAVPEMRVLDDLSDGALWIGGAVTLSEIIDSPSTPSALKEAASSIASEQIRNVATVGGNLVQAKRCWFFRNGFDCYKRAGVTAPCYAVTGDHRFYHSVIDAHRCQAVTPSDLATVLTALDAEVVLTSTAGERIVPMGSLYKGPGETVLRSGEVIRAVRIGALGRSRSARFRKLNLWTGDFAVVSVAVAIGGATGDTTARMVFGALGPKPWRAKRTERLIEDGASLPEVLAELDEELSDHGHPLANNAWKLDAAHGLGGQAVEDVLTQCAEHKAGVGRLSVVGAASGPATSSNIISEGTF